MNKNNQELLKDESRNVFPEWIMILQKALEEYMQKERENAKV